MAEDPAGRAFEDFAVGQVHEIGSVTVDANEVVAFAERYDPQPFHLSEAGGAASPFGGLVASGWHTAAMFMRLYVDGLLRGSTSQGSPGVDALRWLAPVRPGTRLSGRVTVTDVRPSATRPDRGTVTLDCELVDEDGTVVLRFVARGLFGRRTTAS